MDNTIAWMLAIAAFLYIGGALLAIALPGTTSLLASMVAAAVAGVADFVAGAELVTGHAGFEANLYRLEPLGMLQVRADPTSGLFLVLIGALSVGVAVYSWGYMTKFEGRSFRVFGVLFELLLLSLVGIVLANDLALFLMSWESMSILSYLLVSFEHEDQKTADAGFLMLTMSQLGAAAFLIAFLLLGSSVHGIGFDQMRVGAPGLSGSIRTAAFLLFFFGFGTKAGIVPLQVWLPVAHPASPSNISALLSAVIVNMGIYGILRFGVEMVGVGPVWWGFVVAGVGSLSAVLGILYALMERDIIPDIGSKVGIAIAGVFLALTAGLAVTAFVKAYGITFLGMARTDEAEHAREVPRSMRWGMGILAVQAVILGVLPTTFIPWFARLASGVYGPNITNDVVPAVYAHPGQYPLLIHLGGGLFQPIVPARGPIILPGYASFAASSPTYLALSFLICVPLVGLIGWWMVRVRTTRQAEVWAGGLESFTSNYQYTASAYANPIRIIFAMIYRPGREAETQFESSRYFRISVRYRAYVVPFFERYVYPAVTSSVTGLAQAAKVIQSGSVNLYLAYLFAILIIVLVAVR